MTKLRKGPSLKYRLVICFRQMPHSMSMLMLNHASQRAAVMQRAEKRKFDLSLYSCDHSLVSSLETLDKSMQA